MKRVITYIITALLVLSLSIVMPGDYELMKHFGFNTSRAFSVQPGDSADVADTEASSKAVTTIESDLDLYKGDSTYIDIHYTDEDSVTVVSADEQSVKVNSKGRVTALKCGVTPVTVRIEGPESVCEVKVNVHVTSSSYDSVESRGSGAELGGASPYLVLYRTCTKGTSGSVATVSGEDGEKFTYTSTNDSVVSVTSEGEFKARKKGTANIIVSEEDAQGSRQLMVCSVTVEKKKSPEVTDEDIDNWFSNSVIAGNSISLGYEYYLNELQDSFMSDTVHLSASCYSILNDSKEVSGNSLHPVLDGVKRKVSDHVRFLTPDKVFLCFGMNDLNIYGPAGAAEQYGAFMDELHNAAPDAQIYVFSMTPVKYSSGNLTPAGITEFNDLVRKYTKKNDYASYIDFYSGMVDDWGFLKGQYCSDGFCHLTNSAYNYWAEVLKDYATQQIIREIKAEDAVDTYVESKDASQLNKAKKQVSKLANAALRSSLETKLG